MIRPARMTDAAAVRACARAAYERYVPMIGREPAPMTEDYGARIAAGRVHVATENGDLHGFVVFWPQEGVMLLDNVAVRPDMAGRGLGAALIRHCEAAARRHGLPRVRLYTNAKMADNLAIYRHLGFAPVHRRTEGGFDRIYLEKALE